MTLSGVTWDAIIINYNGGPFLEPCLRALTQNINPPGQIIVVDNASIDDSLNELAGWPQADIIQSPQNLGYAGGANLGMRSSESPIAVFLNPDVELDPEFGRGVCDLFERDPKLGVAGAKLRFPGSDRIQHAGGIVHRPVLTTSHVGEGEVDEGQFDDTRESDFVTGAALAVRRSTFDIIDGFDEGFYPAYWEDVDLCWRARDAGYAVRYEPALTAIHHEGAGQTRGSDYYQHWTRNRLRFSMKHLSSQEWWHGFLPAEISRLRGELSAVETPEWWVNSGADSIEHLARIAGSSSSTAPFDTGSVTDPDRLNEAINAVRELPELSDPRPGPLRPSDGVLRRLKRFLSRFSGRIYAEDLYWHQRQFNESVVRAFEAQDRLNRELVVQLLLTLLISGGPRNTATDPTTSVESD